MDTSGPYPILVNGEPVANVPAYTEALATALIARDAPTPLVAVDLLSTDQTLGTGTVETPIIWNARNPDKDMNPDGFRDRLVAPVAGWYFVDATVIFSNVSGGQRSMGFQVWNAGVKLYRRGANNTSPVSSYFCEINAGITVYLAAGDYVKVTVEVVIAAASVSVKANQGTRASMKFLRP